MIADHLAQVRQLRALAGTRPHDELIADMHRGAQRLECMLRNWLTFPPRESMLVDADNALEGLRQSLRQLRSSQQGGSDAA